jgi:hypothetical protein
MRSDRGATADIGDCPGDIAADVRCARLPDNHVSTDMRRMRAGVENVSDRLGGPDGSGNPIKRGTGISIGIPGSGATRTNARRMASDDGISLQAPSRCEQLVRIVPGSAIHEQDAIATQRYDDIGLRLGIIQTLPCTGYALNKFEAGACCCPQRSHWSQQLRRFNQDHQDCRPKNFCVISLPQSLISCLSFSSSSVGIPDTSCPTRL